MSNTERDNLLEKANELGLEFAKNISTKKLQEMVDEAEGPKVKPAEEEPAASEAKVNTPRAPLTREQRMRQRTAEARAKALKTRVVTITNKDNRENDVATTAHLSFENQFFGLAKNVPLDVPVELEQALIDIAENCVITHHRDEVIEGKRTGNKVPVQVKKYVVSYAKQ